MELIAQHLVKRSDLGFHGNLFGGQLLSWLDGAAAGYAMQLCDTPRMVTVSIDTCNFEKPARESQLLKIYAYPTRVGSSSVTLYVEARAHNVRNGKQSVVLKTYTTFVHIDEDGHAIPIHYHSREKINNLIELEKTSKLIGSN